MRKLVIVSQKKTFTIIVFIINASYEKVLCRARGREMVSFISIIILITISLCIDTTNATLPQCSYQCSNPTCDAICVPHCEPAVCQVCYNETGTPECITTDQCSTQCGDPPVYVSDQCPLCDTHCPGTLCDPDDPHCQILCEAPVCSWKCSPCHITKPICVRQCEEPSCVYSVAPSNQVPLWVMVIITVLSLSLYL